MLTELKIKRILFATDFLQSSRLALDYAVAFAHHFKAIIIMLHVVELSNPAMEAELVTMRPCMTRLDAQERLEALAAGPRRAGITVETYAGNGIPCEVILNAVASYKADILVLGIQGVHRGIEHLLIGSTTEKILLSADCPTLTVGANVMAGMDLELRPKEILYFSDFTPEAAAAAPYALLLGKELQVPVDVCQLIPDVAEENQKMREMLAEEYCDMMRRVIPEPPSDWCLAPLPLSAVSHKLRRIHFMG